MNKKLTALEQINEQNKILNEIKQQNVENVKENELIRQQNEIIRTQNEISRIQNEGKRDRELDKEINSINEQLENKANKSEIGSPLIANSVNEMLDITKVYVNTTDGKWYSFNGVEWVVGGVYNSQGIGDSSITPEKTTFFEDIKVLNSNNMLNETEMVLGGLSASTGNVSTNQSSYPNWYTSNFIRINQPYIFTKAFDNSKDKFIISSNRICLYDENKTFIISYSNVTDVKNVEEGYYVRVSWCLDYYSNFFVAFSGTNLDIFGYEKYGVTVTGKIKSEFLNLPTKLSDFENDTKFITKDVIIGNKRDIVCWGDSLTNGVGGISKKYPAQLKLLIGDDFNVINMGRGGDTTIKIGARSGAFPLILEPFTLPSDTTKVEVTFKTYAGAIVANTRPDYGINNCYIDGIDCVLSYENRKYYIKRVSSGDSKIFSRPIQLIPYSYLNYRDCTSILWSGTNDLSLSITEIIQLQKTIIDNFKTERYIVIGLTAKNVFSDIEMRNNEMAKVYGSRFCDVRDYLLNYGLSDNNIVPTEDDTNSISKGQIPPSLLSDETHFNDYGYIAIANCVYRKGKDLGYW